MASRLRKNNFTIIFTNVLISLIVLSIDKSVTAYGGNTLKKCCSHDGVLTKKEEIYSCKSKSEYGVEFFQPISNGTWGFPGCQNGGNIRSIPFAELHSNDNFLRGDFCADIFHGNQSVDDVGSPLPTILFCDNSNQNFQRRNAPTMIKVRRCCPKGEIFRMKNRACLPSDSINGEDISTAALVRNIAASDFIHAVRGPPKCQYAIVDYEVNDTDVSIVAGKLQIRASSSHDIVNFLATEESACLDVGSSPGLLVVRVCRGVEFCRGNACLRKCCGEDEAFVNTTCQKISSDLSLSKWHNEVWDVPKTMTNVTSKIMNTTEYGLLVGDPCRYGKYAVSREEGWHIVNDGMIHVRGYKTYEHHQYCTDMFYNHSFFSDGFYPFICFEDPPPENNAIKTRFRVNAALSLISCAFLLITLLVYVCLPTLQNLHGKTLMCHVASLLMAYGCLAVVAVATPKEEYIDSEETVFSSAKVCRFLGYAMLFAFLSAFFWLNVMCFDIWWKFGSLRHSGITNTKRRDDFKRFIAYCFYAWGLALAVVIIAVIADSIDFLPVNFRPNIGYNRCWFTIEKDAYGEIIFFIGPVAIQLLVNLVFFILTARRCSLVKAEIQRRVMVNRSDPRSRRFEADKTKLILNVKLFVVMGITWVLEIISYFLTNDVGNIEWEVEFFYVSDVVNCLQGLLIFVLFVLKKKVFNALRRRFTKGSNRRASTGGILDPYRVRKSPSSSTILSTFAVSSSP